MKNKGCPYLNTYSKTCVHKEFKVLNSKTDIKNYCPYKNKQICPLYMELLEIKKSIARATAEPTVHTTQ